LNDIGVGSLWPAIAIEQVRFRKRNGVGEIVNHSQHAAPCFKSIRISLLVLAGLLAAGNGVGEI